MKGNAHQAVLKGLKNEQIFLFTAERQVFFLTKNFFLFSKLFVRFSPASQAPPLDLKEKVTEPDILRKINVS